MAREHRGWHVPRGLPHFDTPETPQFVTFRTADSLPKAVAFARARAKVTRRIDAASRPRSIRARAPVRSFARKSRKRSWTRCCMETALPTTCALSPSCPTTCTFSRCFAKVAGSQTSLEVGRAFRRGGFWRSCKREAHSGAETISTVTSATRTISNERTPISRTTLSPPGWRRLHKIGGSAALAFGDEADDGGAGRRRRARRRSKGGASIVIGAATPAAVSITPSSAGAPAAPGGRSKSARIFLFPKIRKTCYGHRVRCRKDDLDGRQV